MSGYTGNADDEAMQALIFAENAIHASSLLVSGSDAYVECQKCWKEISVARRNALAQMKMPCKYCVDCQDKVVRRPNIKMLDRIL